MHYFIHEKSPPPFIFEHSNHIKYSKIFKKKYQSPLKYLSGIMKASAFLIILLLLGGCLTNRGGEETIGSKKDLNQLPDAVPIFDDGKKYILTDPTTEYRHGVLGDAIEAGTLTIIEGDEFRKIDFSPQVFEGLFPLLADFDGDGEKEIIATLSGNGAGAQLVVYDQLGDRIASSESLPSGWRHALAVEPFGPEGELELADLSRPHVSREVEFFQLKRDKLVKVAGIKRYSTHSIGSRNLELFDVIEEDGRLLLIVPTHDFRSIAAIGRTPGGVEEVWRIEINETIQSISVMDGMILVNGVQIK
jgi:hypothetical protein